MKTSRLVASLLALSLASIAAAQDGAPPQGGPGQDARRGGRQGQPPDPAQAVDRLMGMDANGEGKLSRDEMPPMLVERIFERADANKDGFVERAELEIVMKDPEALAGLRGGMGRGGAGGPGGAGAPNMEGAMKQANAALRALKSSALDASTQKSDLEAVQRLQMGLVGSKGAIGAVPMSDAAKAKFGADKAAYEREFRKTILASIMTAFEVEDAILAGDASRAKAGIAKLEKSEESGHELFQREHGDGGEQPSGGEGAERPRGRGGRGNRPPAAE